MNQSHSSLWIVLVGLITPTICAQTPSEALTNCQIVQLQQSEETRTVGEIEAWCQQFLANQNKENTTGMTALEKRISREQTTMDLPNVITPHKRNYILPVTYMDDPHETPYENTLYAGKLDNWEAKFQLSFKAPMFKSVLQERDMVFFGFTVQSYWQMYNSEISSPFRETNYQPEIFYGMVNDFEIGGWTNRVNIIGIEHQSNGQAQPQSRSWNRIYAEFIFENEDWVIGFKPWYRIPEERKTELNQPSGDDNPDIGKYMGNFELTGAYKWDAQSFGFMFRNNLRSENRGAIQLDWTFSLGTRYRGYAQYFYGYGESLIDYNETIQRFGVGVLLTDLF
jgi:phospholipase A1/A2